MDPLLTETFHDVIDDTLTFSSVIYHYMSYSVPRRYLSEVCSKLLEGDASWETWLFDNAPPELLRRLHENPLNLLVPPSVPYDSEDYVVPASTAFVNHIRVMALSVACDLAILPFWALKVNHIAGVYRTEALGELVSVNKVAGRFLSNGLLGQLSALYNASNASFAALVANALRGSTAICALGLLRNYSSILAREDESSTVQAATFSYTLEDTGGLDVANRDSKNRIKSMALLHNGQHSQKSTGRPTHNGLMNKRMGERRASGNVYYDSTEDVSLTESERKKLPFVPQAPQEKPQISLVGRALIAVLLHPLELIAVRQVTSSAGGYGSFLKSVSSIYYEGAGSTGNFFRGWRSTLINAVFIPKGGWFMMGIPYLVRVRRMLPEWVGGGSGGGEAEGGKGLAEAMGVERIGQSLEILRGILSPGGGGVAALLAGAEANVRSLIPSFLCLFAARVAVHAVFGRSEKARIRRVRRDAFVRLFFEKAKMGERGGRSGGKS
jgi:hypothetical protein